MTNTELVVEEFVMCVLRALVTKPEGIIVERIEDEESIMFQVTVAEADLGLVLGSQGKLVRSIRTLLLAMGRKRGRRFYLSIANPKKTAVT